VVKLERCLGQRLNDVRGFIDGLYEHDLHAKRVDALAGATLGVMTSASLAVAVIGQALAQARGLITKHAIKQVDRLLSNQNIDVWDSFAHWVPHLIGSRKEIVVAMDWTDFERDGQATLALNLVSGHGRATPLLWVTVWKDELTEQRNDFEDACLLRLKELVPSGCAVTILADRGFGDHKLFKFLDDLDFGYVIRFRGNIHVTDAAGQTRPAADWIGKSGRARKLRAAQVTASHAYKVGAVVCVQAKAMKEPWCLAVSNAEASTAMQVNYQQFSLRLSGARGNGGESGAQQLGCNVARRQNRGLARTGKSDSCWTCVHSIPCSKRCAAAWSGFRTSGEGSTQPMA
jgi:hypothetical protein